MYSILVVDDAVENIDILTGILQDEYYIKAATSGVMALKIAEKTRPDIILLDIIMPEMDGYEVCRKLKENPRTCHIPVIFVTAKDQEIDEAKGFAYGAVDYINKPVSPVITRARLKNHLALSDQKKALEIEVDKKTVELQKSKQKIEDYSKNLEQKVTERTCELEAKNKELREALQTIKNTQKKLIELDMHKTETLYMVTHDLRTPMTSILGFSNLITKKYQSTLLPVLESCGDRKVIRSAQQVLDNIHIISEEGKRLTNLINDFLDLSKLEEGKAAFNPEKIELGQIIKEAVDSLRSLLEEKKLKSVIEVEPPQLVVNADRGKLFQVLINLLSNAIKFTKEGSVTCRAGMAEKGREIVVSIIDTGCGISKEEQESVFDKFSQAGNQTGSKQKGTGLGLPICKQAVELHGGRIRIESEPDRGSTFSFTLPLNQGDGSRGS